MANVVIDIIGIVVDLGPVGNIKLRTGENKDKRNIVICDDTNYSISITLWGDTATRLDLKPGQLVACKQCKVSEYNGRTLNGGSSLSDYVIDSVNHPRAVEVKRWHSKFSNH